jgi:hypothetical protein
MVHQRIYSDDWTLPVREKEQIFNTRCAAELRKRNITATTEKLPILGTRVLGDSTKQGQYIPKLRSLVAFLLDNPQYDDSLILFYPYTPKGIVTCQDLPVSLFLLSKTGVAGSPLKDIHVRSGTRRDIYYTSW